MQRKGNKSVLITSDNVKGILAQASVPGKRLLDPLKSFSKSNGMPINILEDKIVDNDAEVHTHEADIWHCLEGEVIFVVGGEMVDPRPKDNKDGTFDNRELKSKEIKGGTEVPMKAGDWLWIPAGEPHKHKTDGTARLVIIKIPSYS